MSGITDSAKFNSASSYYFPGNGNTVVGVTSLNNKSGSLSITSADNSLVVSTATPNVIDLSTTGTVQNVASLSAGGAVTGATVSGTTSISSPKITCPALGTGVSLGAGIVSGASSTPFFGSFAQINAFTCSGGAQPVALLNSFLAAGSNVSVTAPRVLLVNILPNYNAQAGGSGWPDGSQIAYQSSIVYIPGNQTNGYQKGLPRVVQLGNDGGFGTLIYTVGSNAFTTGTPNVAGVSCNVSITVLL